MATGFTSVSGTPAGGRYQGVVPLSIDLETFFSDEAFREILIIRAATRNMAPTLPNQYRFLQLCEVEGEIVAVTPRQLVVYVASPPSTILRWLVENYMPIAAGKRCRVEVSI
jgi:hypothetical protein